VSYAYIEKQVNVTWFRDSAIRFNREIGLPEFLIADMDVTYCDGSYRYAIMLGGTHKFGTIFVGNWEIGGTGKLVVNRWGVGNWLGSG
jgi:hypothetical protein